MLRPKKQLIPEHQEKSSNQIIQSKHHSLKPKTDGCRVLRNVVQVLSYIRVGTPICVPFLFIFIYCLSIKKKTDTTSKEHLYCQTETTRTTTIHQLITKQQTKSNTNILRYQDTWHQSVNREVGWRNFRSDPKSRPQSSQREKFRVIHHTVFENYLIAMTQNISYHRNPHTSQNLINK